MQLHAVLSRYHLKEFSFTDSTHASMLLHHIASQCHQPHALSDALLLVNAYGHLAANQARVLCLQNLVVCPPLTSELVFCRGDGGGGAEGPSVGRTASPGQPANGLCIGPLTAQLLALRRKQVVAWLTYRCSSENDQLAVAQEVLQFCFDTLDGAVDEVRAHKLLFWAEVLCTKWCNQHRVCRMRGDPCSETSSRVWVAPAQPQLPSLVSPRRRWYAMRPC